MNIFTIIIIIIFIAVIICISYKQIYTESLDVSLTHNSSIAKVDLKNFFQFIEYFQINDLDTHPYNQNIYLSDEFEKNNIRNRIKQILIYLKKISSDGSYVIYDHYGNNQIHTDLNIIKDLLQKDTDGSMLLKINIMRIISTDTYKQYIYAHKHDIKYRGIVFNPHMVEI